MFELRLAELKKLIHRAEYEHLVYFGRAGVGQASCDHNQCIV